MQINEAALTKLVLKSEGGYCNDAGDPGGPTKYGITIADVRKYLKAGATAEDVKALTLDQAIEIYDKHYWDPMSGDVLPSGLDYVVYDYGINSGIGRPPLVLSRLLNLPSTGRIDTAILTKLKTVDPDKLIDAVCDERLHFMHQIRGGDAWARFGGGWGTRVASVRKSSHLLARATPAPVVIEQHPDKTEPTPKATHVDPNLPTKIVVAGSTTSAGSAAAAQSGTHEALIALAVATGVLIVVGGVGYAIYRGQLKKQATVILPPGLQTF